MDKEKSIKPCPFCGSEEVKIFEAPLRGTIMFVCPSCGADVCFYGAEYEPEASIAWNRRSTNATI